MEGEEIQAKIRQNLYIYTAHGDIERQVEEALLKGEILEQSFLILVEVKVV